jgi:hypothetical protein
MPNWLKNLLAVVALVALFLWISSLLVSLSTQAAALAPARSLLGNVGTELSGWTGKSVINVALALLVGFLGAIAFYFGVLTGFIGRESRNKTLEFLSGAGWTRWVCVGFFCVLGGVVAAVFQSAQPETFAPIQAFVLGATWPSVVTRIMSGEAGGRTSAEGLADPSAHIPTASPTQSASDAEVVI